MRRFEPMLLGVASFAIILLAWEAGVRVGWLNPASWRGAPR
jgi:hypothetical protein